MSRVQIKICGMKHNVAEVATLQPAYLGFIFYKKSPRNFEGDLPPIPKGVKKVGVFVNATIEDLKRTVSTYQLNVIQLHGEESAIYCKKLKQLFENKKKGNHVAIWKVFGIKDQFDFSILTPYEPFVDAFLFDTKGEHKGGNGIVFNWELLKEYPSTKPFILSGGVDTSHVSEIKKMKQQGLPITAIDINSKFEIKPGLKDISAVKKMIQELA